VYISPANIDKRSIEKQSIWMTRESYAHCVDDDDETASLSLFASLDLQLLILYNPSPFP
jgi:hypothetical protein